MAAQTLTGVQRTQEVHCALYCPSQRQCSRELPCGDCPGMWDSPDGWLELEDSLIVWGLRKLLQPSSPVLHVGSDWHCGLTPLPAPSIPCPFPPTSISHNPCTLSQVGIFFYRTWMSPSKGYWAPTIRYTVKKLEEKP